MHKQDISRLCVRGVGAELACKYLQKQHDYKKTWQYLCRKGISITMKARVKALQVGLNVAFSVGPMSTRSHLTDNVVII